MCVFSYVFFLCMYMFVLIYCFNCNLLSQFCKILEHSRMPKFGLGIIAVKAPGNC